MGDFRNLLEQMMALPLKGQIQIDFDFRKKTFRLTVPVFSSKKSISPAVQEYVEARMGRFFQPHATSFVLEGDKRVHLVQEIPFRWGFQPAGLRNQVHEFCRFAKGCHRLLMELATEEAFAQS